MSTLQLLQGFSVDSGSGSQQIKRSSGELHLVLCVTWHLTWGWCVVGVPEHDIVRGTYLNERRLLFLLPGYETGGSKLDQRIAATLCGFPFFIRPPVSLVANDNKTKEWCKKKPTLSALRCDGGLLHSQTPPPAFRDQKKRTTRTLPFGFSFNKLISPRTNQIAQYRHHHNKSESGPFFFFIYYRHY